MRSGDPKSKRSTVKFIGISIDSIHRFLESLNLKKIMELVSGTPLDENYSWANLLYFLEIDDGLESYMQFVISCEVFVQFEFLSNNKFRYTF